MRAFVLPGFLRARRYRSGGLFRIQFAQPRPDNEIRRVLTPIERRAVYVDRTHRLVGRVCPDVTRRWGAELRRPE